MNYLVKYLGPEKDPGDEAGRRRGCYHSTKRANERLLASRDPQAIRVCVINPSDQRA